MDIKKQWYFKVNIGDKLKLNMEIKGKISKSTIIYIIKNGDTILILNKIKNHFFIR